MMLIVWVIAGGLGMMGSLCYCELGGILKVAGGNYVNILKVYGRLPGFLCAWATCLVIDPSTLSAIGLTIGKYLSKPFYGNDNDGETAAKVIAFVVILMALFVNCLSSVVVNHVQRVLAVMQVSSVLFLIAVGIYQLTQNTYDNFHDVFNGTHFSSKDLVQLGLATFGALWSYDGWSCMNNVIEEMKNVKRDLLLTVVTAFPFVIVCYILANLALLTLLSRQQMAASDAVAIDFVSTSVNKKASYVMMTLVGLAAYGTLNGTLFAVPRLTLAAAREGHMPKFLSFIHAQTRAPVPAAILSSVIGILMLMPKASDLDSLILMFSQAQWVIYGASIFGVIVLRIRQPNVDRPYKVFILFPVIMTLVAIILVVMPFFEKPLLSLALFSFILAGIPVYVIFLHYQQKLPKAVAAATEGFCNKLEHLGLTPCQVNDL